MTSVLVVDDEADLRTLMRLLLEQHGCTVLEATNGIEALETLGRERVDLVLLDLRMSPLDGWGVIERLKTEGRIPGLPVVVVSAHADPALFDRVLSEGCCGYLRKPFWPDDLVEMLSFAAVEGG